jgi:predicted transposase
MFVSLQFKLGLKKEDKEKLIQLMRKQSSAIRVAYNMLKELEKEKTKNHSRPNIPQAKTSIS